MKILKLSRIHLENLLNFSTPNYLGIMKNIQPLSNTTIGDFHCKLQLTPEINCKPLKYIYNVSDSVVSEKSASLHNCPIHRNFVGNPGSICSFLLHILKLIPTN